MKITYKEYQEFWAALDAVPGHKDNWYEDDVGNWPDKPKPSDTLDLRAGFLQGVVRRSTTPSSRVGVTG